MKTYFFFLLFILCSNFTNAQHWSLLKSFPTNKSKGLGNVTDADNNTYLTGTFERKMYINGDSLTGANATKTGYLIKCNSFGDVIWKKSFGSIGDISSIALDNQGNILLTGNFFDTITFGNFHLTSNGFSDIFLTKYDSSGNVLWAKRYGGNGEDLPGVGTYAGNGGISADRDGNIYMIGSIEPDTTNISQFANIHIAVPKDSFVHFIMKMNSLGTPLWVTPMISSSGSTVGTSIKADTLGNVYFSLIIDVPHLRCGNTIYNLGNSYTIDNGIVGMLDPSGVFQWVKTIAGSRNNLEPNDLVVNSKNELIVVGENHGDSLLYFDGIATKMDSNGAFIAKFDHTGAFKWARSMGGGGSAIAYHIEIDKNDDLYIGGRCSNGALIGNDVVNCQIGSYAAIIAKYTSSGSEVWVRPIFSNGDCDIRCLSLSSDGSITCTGRGNGLVTTAGNFTTTNSAVNSDGTNVFLARLSGTTGIPIVEQSNNWLSLYPNPSGGQVHLQFAEQGNYTIMLTDVTGRTLGVYELKNQRSKDLDLNSLANGIYTITVTGEGLTSSKNITIKR